MKNIIELIRNAADILETKGHCRHLLIDKEGRHCAWGALIAAKGNLGGNLMDYFVVKSPDIEEGAIQIAIRAQGADDSLDGLIDWNNQPERTRDEVVSVFRQTANELEAAI